MTPWLHRTRRVLEASSPTARPSFLPLEDWLESAACRAAAKPVIETPDPSGWLPGLQLLTEELRALGLAERGACFPSLELAVITDLLDPTAPEGTLRGDLLRRGIRRSEAPLEHAAYLLLPTPQERWAMLGHQRIREPLLDHSRALVQHATAGPRELAQHLLEELEALASRLVWSHMKVRVTQPEPDELLSEALERSSSLVDPAALTAEGCRGSWELQAGGIDGHRPLVGDLFGPLLLLEALARAGHDVRDETRALLTGRLGQGLRYYRDAPWMPHDSDDAAAILITLRTTGTDTLGLEPSIEEASAVLRLARRSGGALDTWVALPDTSPVTPPARWFGQRCAGVVARAIRALSIHPGIHTSLELRESIAWLTDQADPDGGYSSAYYPSRTVTTGLVVEALAAARAAGLESDGMARAGSWLQRQQRPDGSWGGSAVETAAAVLALDAAEVLPPAQAADALAFLVRAQRWDGLWPGGDLMICPQAGGALGTFGSPALTAAMARAASESARRVIAPWLAAPCSS
jgi:hypothetical protein